MRPYAAETDVTVAKSKTQIENLLAEFKATSIMMGSNQAHAVIAFEMAERRVKFLLPLPQSIEFDGRRYPMSAMEQATRTRWRALYLALRAKLEMAATGITSFESEFLSHIVLPDGQTVGKHTRPMIEAAYKSGKVTPLLPDYSGSPR